ncbi:NADH-quinone oxidoreductase subunit NuoE [Acidaminobacter sp. JC074]|uniref:NADH-quinone oxidoreductase subunit NuoE n=1 Tax=Acidaminobacter sp. JC074 TaxID=2530199 RepID=UPI001F0DB3FE|nr:NADH-quinone oxidoreductase subunit NuoE [Acidaminobacter sp. JC074]MCH4891252.1 NADH-quinone oxidoreductase subunit NuoE [Acidaminobacter sp. JC074]
MTCSCQNIRNNNTRESLEILEQILLECDEETNLITLLQKVQNSYGYLPENVMKEIAIKRNIKEAKVYGVASFYSQFRMKPIGKYLIMLCQGTACHVNGSAAIESALKDILDVSEGEITPDGLFTYINVACLGCCSLAPVMMINDQTYAKLTYDKVNSIISEIRGSGK